MSRADISILVENVTFSREDAVYQVKGYVINEGSRTTFIQDIRLGLCIPEDSWEARPGLDSISLRPSMFMSFYGWNNSVLEEREMKRLVISTYVFILNPEFYFFSNNYSVREGFVKIMHYDGVSVQEQSVTFRL